MRKAFSLVELLVATTILLIIGGSLATLLLQSFNLWEYGVASTRGLVPTALLRERLQRDFNSTLTPLSFTGTTQRCHFWIVEPDAAIPRLTQVQYQFGKKTALRRTLTPSGRLLSQETYQPITTLSLSYAPHPASPTSDWTSTWQSPTNTPHQLLLKPTQGTPTQGTDPNTKNSAIHLLRITP